MRENPYEKHIPVTAELAKEENFEEHLETMRSRKAYINEYLEAEKGNLAQIQQFRTSTTTAFTELKAKLTALLDSEQTRLNSEIQAAEEIIQ